MTAQNSAPRARRNRHVAIAVVGALGLGATGASVANAQTSATSQYSSGSAAGATTTTTEPALRRVDYAAFGTGDGKVRRDVVRAFREAGLRFRRLDSSDSRVQRYITSPLARQLATGGPFAVGRATATELRQSTSRADQVFHTIFDTKLSYQPITASVLSRGDHESASQGQFVRGLANGFGSTGIATVYVERTDDKDKHLDEFANIPGVSTVPNIDEAAGRRRLVALLTGGSSTAPASTDAKALKAKTAAALVNGNDDGAPTGLIAALGLIGAAAAFVVGGTFRRRTRRS